MESARYGRMQAGRCVSGYGKLGCFVDVLWYMDRRCSGRRYCRVYVADPVLHKVDVCHSDLTSYLEAKHTCVTGKLHHNIHVGLQENQRKSNFPNDVHLFKSVKYCYFHEKARMI